MEISEVRVKLMEDSDDRLQAFCSITFDNCFVIRDLKIIEGTSGPFVAMPSRKLTSHCGGCGAKNHLRAAYCNHCGGKQKEDRAVRDADGRTKLYADIAHPINSICREMIQTRVISEYRMELERVKQPGYASKYDDDYGFDAGEDYVGPADERAAVATSPPLDNNPPSFNGSRLIGRRIDRGSGDPGPRSPHCLPQSAQHGDSSRTAQAKPQRGDFGAGIFD